MANTAYTSPLQVARTIKQIYHSPLGMICLPKNAAFIIRTLEEHGYEAYVVGGCVRDMVLGREPGTKN